MHNSDIDTKIVISSSCDPWNNLALEEFLLGRVSPNQVILYLWQNQNTVVLGRNQNAWKECDFKLLESEGGKLSRRLSGGGAVFHDLGNLNYTFIMERKYYNLEIQMQVILDALDKLRIKGEYTGRNDLTFQGKKFSGNAFYFRTNTAYHHGTLLINTDLSKLVRYLRVSEDKIRSKGIDSVRSRVINLSDIQKGLSLEDVVDSLKESFHSIYGGESTELQSEMYTSHLTELYDKYASWQWRLGESPNFDISFKKRFSWGDAELGFVLKNGIIVSTVLYSDAMDSSLIQEIALKLNGVPFHRKAVSECLNNISTYNEGKNMIHDLIEWLSKKI